MNIIGIIPIKKNTPEATKKRIKFHQNTNWAKGYKEKILEKTNGLCWLCGEPIVFKSDFSRDHKVPLSKGGSNKFENLYPAHKSCNGKKGDMIINSSDEFLSIFRPKQFLKSNKPIT